MTRVPGAALLVLALLGAAGGRAEAADGGAMRATVGRPAVLPIRGSAPAAGRTGAGPPRLIVTVVGYTPSADGPVAGLVAMRCGGTETEVGRFGVFPDEAFAPDQPDRAQRFAFDLPACGGEAFAVVSLEPVLGTGREAALDLAAAAVE